MGKEREHPTSSSEDWLQMTFLGIPREGENKKRECGEGELAHF